MRDPRCDKLQFVSDSNAHDGPVHLMHYAVYSHDDMMCIMCAGGQLNVGVILVLGFSNIFADALSMGVGEYLSSKV